MKKELIFSDVLKEVIFQHISEILATNLVGVLPVALLVGKFLCGDQEKVSQVKQELFCSELFKKVILSQQFLNPPSWLVNNQSCWSQAQEKDEGKLHDKRLVLNALTKHDNNIEALIRRANFDITGLYSKEFKVQALSMTS